LPNGSWWRGLKDIAKITELKGSEVYVLISRLYKKGMIFKALANLRNSSLVVEFSIISCIASTNPNSSSVNLIHESKASFFSSFSAPLHGFFFHLVVILKASTIFIVLCNWRSNIKKAIEDLI
jgi:hypothetical protein